jgi:site-specific recombinase XerD
MQNALVELTPSGIVPGKGAKASMDELIGMVIATCVSAQTRRAYRAQLVKFMTSGLPLNREGVALFLQSERDNGNGYATMGILVAAIRKLATEAQMRGLMTFEELSLIKSVKPGKQYKTRAGHWLTANQAFDLLDVPDRSTYWGKRDAAILSLMLGCGLRRAEMAAMRWTHYQTREDRPCLVDFKGKGDKLRTIPVPTWAQEDVDAWRVAQQQEPPAPEYSLRHLERRRPRDTQFIAGGMTGMTVHRLVSYYGHRAGHTLAPHDLRRSLAQMLRKSGAPLEQIQATLGHESIETTALYLGSKLELERGKASVDQLRRTK